MLLIRVADHDRDKLVIDLERAERSKSQRNISKAQGKLNRFDIRQSIVDKDKYFDVEDKLDEQPVKINGIETEMLSGAKRIIRDFRHRLYSLRGKDIYNADTLRRLVNEAYSSASKGKKGGRK